MDSPRNILRTLKESKRILIPLHLRPDGDSIGSALASYHLFRNMGKKVVVASADPLPEVLLFLPAAKRIKIVDPENLPLENFDLVFLPDISSPNLISSAGKLNFPAQTILVNVDHHKSNRNYGDLNYVIPKASATAEIIYDLARAWKMPIPPEVADCLLTGIYTDTGGFLYPSTTADSLEKASELIRGGANRDAVAENSFRSWSPKAIKLWALILANARIRKNVAYSQVPYSQLKTINYSQSEFAGIRGFAVSNLLLSIKDVRAAALFTESKPRQIRVNLRSIGNLDISKIAEKWGGGGHSNSAVFDYRGPIKDIVPKTVKLLQGPIR
ncbi:hypothetical protein A2V54_03160 [candidate division WWE3 bacterium RBG_19FT_COMBO_53_11]|uniref:Uncharacterized protein n=1 Tax=candidate division WWE3 bacterium RBG_19FT_COMBO_53_11 TaxID=1802613 RepID=A0A1F4UHH3_UNCKA|nr:MAG: hypothetical protein A2V54_03160 [candidate division WWE3 bacterium RBG_19FT_COMBO_53_11]